LTYNKLHARILGTGALTAVAIWLVPVTARTIALPLAAAVLLAVWFWLLLARRSSVPPTGEIGAWFVAIVLLYTVVPLIVYLLIGQEFTPFNDNRLVVVNPPPSEMAAVAWLYVLFLASFAVAYLAIRGRVGNPVFKKEMIDPQTLGVLFGMWLVLQLLAFVFVPKFATSSYEQSYVAAGSLPLVVRQIVKLSSSWGFILALGLRVWLFQAYSQRKLIIWLWVAYDVFVAVTSPGARTGIVVTIAATLLLYHYFVKPVKPRIALIFAVGVVVGFLVLGVLRAGSGTAPVAGGEFESLFANAIDLRSRVASGEVGNLPLSFHLADLLAAVPSQILPFVKQDPSAWYITTFYPWAAEQGAGAAFGVIAQSTVGGGWLDLVIRGLLLGAGFAALHRYFVKNSLRFWVVVLYVWTTVWAYQSFRNLSFIFVGSIIQVFIPLLLMVEGLRIVLVTLGAGSPPITNSVAISGSDSAR
jgi:hypothetical protein